MKRNTSSEKARNNDITYVNKTQFYINKLFDSLFYLVTVVKEERKNSERQKKI